MSTSPYLTVAEASSTLGITEDAVRKHIRRGNLSAIRRSERKILIPRSAFDAYLRNLNGEAAKPVGRLVAARSLEQRVAAFETEAGQHPKSWLQAWLSEQERDALADMELASAAVGLVAELRAAPLADGATRRTVAA